MRNISLSVLVLTIAAIGSLRASASDPQEQSGLGELSLANSGSAEVQTKFHSSLKLLHNFEYEEALDGFRECQAIEPTFAMAYWGEAMCHNRPLWGEQDLEAAQAVLARLEETETGHVSALEETFLDSVQILFGDGDKRQRDIRYEEVLANAAKQFPNNDEIACFHALALLGTCAGNRDVRVYMRAAGILEQVYENNAEHPGVLHYLIHCYDDATHAPLGLRAARAYSSVAQNSAHAQHMPSHIYLPMGMWHQMVNANEAAWRAGEERRTRRELPAGDYDIHALHALQWLHYGYIQQARYADAKILVERMREIYRANPNTMVKWYYSLMQASHVVNVPESGVWEEIDLKGIELSSTASVLFSQGLQSIRDDSVGATFALDRIRELRRDAELKIEERSHHHSSYFEGVYASSIRSARIMETQLEALNELTYGEAENAISRLKDAAAEEDRMPVGYGPPIPVKPSLELLGEVLLRLDRNDEALAAFQQSLDRIPGRTTSLIGLAEAAERLEEKNIKAEADSKVREQCGERKPFKSWCKLPRVKADGN